MEQQPGPVNWAPYNPAPLPGMVRVWSFEAFAHGAEFVNYFRWRQLPFGQEQMHAGLLLPDGSPSIALKEIAQLAEELRWVETAAQQDAPIGLVFDYASAWAWETQPQGQDFDYFKLVYAVYCGLRVLGQSVDILPPDTQDFGARQLVLIPGLFAWTDELKTAMARFDGELLIGPRTGSKTDDFHIPNTLPPDMKNFDLKVSSVESLRPSETVALEGEGAFHIWREHVETSEAVSLRCADASPALITKGNRHYLCGWPDEKAMKEILTQLLTQAKCMIEPMPEGVRVHPMGNYRLYTNYSAKAQTVNGEALPAAAIRLVETKTGRVIISK